MHDHKQAFVHDSIPSSNRGSKLQDYIFSQQTTANSGEDMGCTYYNTACSSQFMRSDRVSISRWTDPKIMVYAHSGTSTLKEWSTHSGAFTLKGCNYATCWRCMQIEIITGYRLSQTQKDKCHMRSLMYRVLISFIDTWAFECVYMYISLCMCYIHIHEHM